MRLSQYFPPLLNFIITILGLIYGIYILISGLKGEKKSFFIGWLSMIKNPVINIIYGVIIIIIFSVVIVKYVLEL